MASESCFVRSKPEQLYMLEFLVDHIKLTPEKISEIGSKPLTVRLEFLDFPAFEISEEEFWSSMQRQEKQSTLLSERKSKDGALDFSAGKSCLFPKRPDELVEAMRLTPLKIGIYSGVVKKICSKDEPEVPVCKSKVPLSGCLCDQVCMAMNDPQHLPQPYTLRNTSNLVDEAENPSGTILLFLRLTCLGKSIVTQFAVKEKSFLFKSSNSSNEFQCKRVPGEDEEEIPEVEPNPVICQPEGHRKPEKSSLPKPSSVVGLVSVCEELAKRDGGPPELVPTRKASTHRFIEEKYNFRDIPAKHAIQNSTCVSQPYGIFSSKTSTTFSCGREDFSNYGDDPKNVRSTNFLFSGRQTLTVNPCIGSTCYDTSLKYLYRPRMRGGGPWNERTGNESPNYKSMYRGKQLPVQSVENLIAGACKSTIGSKKPGCGCFGKTGTGAMGSLKTAMYGKDFGCSNEPCHGIDCMIRAFKETQEFVASIGKGPGLAGLGLMDPSDSPYFGRRDKDEALTSCGRKAPFAPLEKLISGKATGKKAAPPTSGLLPLDPNIQQLDTSFKSKLKKIKDEKAERTPEVGAVEQTRESEGGPCGETDCQSRKKAPSEAEKVEETPQEKVEEPVKKISVEKRISAEKRISLTKKMSSGKSRRRTKQGGKSLPGPAGDRVSARLPSPIKVSKRTMRLMSDFRNSRFCYGHKKCLDVRMRVPGNMGWLWNTAEAPGRLKPLLGWKPGAIPKYVWDRLQVAKKAMIVEKESTAEVRPSTPVSKSKKGKSARSKNFHTLRGNWAKNRGAYELGHDEVELPPALHIHRKDGTYYVTMYPVKPGVETKDGKEPEEEPKPLQFKITKNPDVSDSSSTGSDMEIEFSPPAAIDRYRKKDPVKNKITQVNYQQILDTVKQSDNTPNVKVKKARNKK